MDLEEFTTLVEYYIGPNNNNQNNNNSFDSVAIEGLFNYILKISNRPYVSKADFI